MIPRRLQVLTVLCLLSLVPIGADDTDIIAAAWLDPNVMILLDSSGSMNDGLDGDDDPPAGQAKYELARSVVNTLVTNTSNVNFGVMKFRVNGGEVVSEIGTDPATIVSDVNAMATPSGYTPLGDQMFDAGKYFKGNLGTFSSPIDVECRMNVVIVVSDGMETSSTRDLRDEATLRFTEDHSSGVSGLQNILVHTVGFGIADAEEVVANAFLQEAADNGGGTFYSTDNAAQLQTSLEEAINNVVAGTFAFAGALAPSTSVTGSDKTYQASFLSDPIRPFWEGYVSAFQRDSSGVVPTDGSGVPLASALVWEAGAQLAAKSASTRTIYTEIAGVRQSFLKTNGVITPAVLGVATSGEKDDVIDFIRGIDAYDEDGDSNTSEQRAWKLGDVIHSKPVLITPPVLISTDPAYQLFKTAQASRTTVLVVGANDGMLHAFRDTDGEELWGFIPEDLLTGLQDLGTASGPRNYYVDASPVAADVKIAGAYKTVVVFGERRGGTTYHALDVTDTTNPLYLWSFTDANLGETWSTPVIGRVDLSLGEKFVAFVGGGYDTANNNASGKAIFAIDVETGVKLWEYRNDSPTDDRQHMNYSVAAAPTAVDLDTNGYVDRVYVGDVGGQLWKFDVSADSVGAWTGKRLFTAAPAQANPPPAGDWFPTQAIYGSPTPALDAAGEIWVYFGTGDLNHPQEPSTNRFYGLKDNTNMTNATALTEASMADVTTTNGSGANGWYVRLSGDEKVLASAEVFREDVFWTTFTPVTAATCSSGAGPANLYGVEMSSGYGSINWSTGEELATTNATQPRSTTVGSGIPGEPSIAARIADGTLDSAVVTGTTDQQLDQQEIPDVALRRILYWREVY